MTGKKYRLSKEVSNSEKQNSTEDNTGSTDHINEKPDLSSNIGIRLQNQGCMCFLLYICMRKIWQNRHVLVGLVCL